MKIIWTEDFSVGVPSMDEQHKRLIEMINALVDTSDSSAVFNAIIKMYNYADEHFLAEEALMRRYRYAGLDEQIRAHRNFISKAKDLAARHSSQGDAHQEVYRYLSQWLTEHILKMDMAYKVCFPKKQPT